jgi:DNA-binding response OmpR family regulator
MIKILLVDDEKNFVKGLSVVLEHEGFQVVKAYNGKTGWELFGRDNFDLVLLDLMLPETDGLTICKEIRKVSQVPIIMLTAKGEDIDKIIGLELGADDYITKPFNSRELLARIKAVLRRSIQVKEKTIKQGNSVKKFVVNGENRNVYIDGNLVELTGKEFELIELMWKNPGRVFTREKLLEMVWGFDFFGEERTVDVHIRRLREKIEKDPASPSYILTKWGLGYYFKENVSNED